MKIRFIVVWIVFLGAFQLSAQDWSSWTNTSNRDFQYRWLAAPSEGGGCYLQVRDLKRQPNDTTFVSVLIDYNSTQAESTREVIAVTDSNDSDPGPSILRPCVSVGDVHVNDIVRCGTSGCAGTGFPWL